MALESTITEYFYLATATDICNYWSANSVVTTKAIAWDAFMAALQGGVAGVIKQLRVDRAWKVSTFEQEDSTAELEHIKNPSSLNYHVWRDAMRQLNLLLVQKTQK